MEQSNETQNIQEANQPVVQEEQNKPLFGGVDSQGKERLFNSVEEVQKSWQNSQDFIKNTVQEKQTLEAKVQELEAKVNQSLKLEEALEQLKQKETNQMTQEQSTTATTEQTSQLDIEQLEQQLTEKIMSKLSATQQESVYTQNQTESINAAKVVYGEDFESKLREKAKEFNMSDEDIINTSRTNPTMFKKLFGLDKQTQQNVAPPAGGSTPQNSSAPVQRKPAFFGRDMVQQGVERLNERARQKGIKEKLF